MTITIFITLLFLLVPVYLIWLGMEIEKGLISIAGAVLLVIFFIWRLFL